jgi:hypothetical protein
VLNVSQLALPGLDYLDFGPVDLSFSLENSTHPRLKTLEDCREFVRAELAGSHVRIM